MNILGGSKIYNPAGRSDPKDVIGRSQYQQLINVWTDFAPDAFVYSSESRIIINSFDGQDFFQVGDRLRILQPAFSTDWQYFYITNVTPTYIDISVTDGYYFTNNVISQIATNRVGRPIDFPTALAYIVKSGSYEFHLEKIYNGSGMTITHDSVSIYFSVDNGYCHVAGYINNMTLSDSAKPDIYVMLPINDDANFPAHSLPQFIQDNLVRESGFLETGLSTGAGLSLVDYVRPLRSNWTLGTNVASINLDFTYPVSIV